ncbi:helix-turn-helix domain-containing protein [Pseudomonas kulmbachensis]|uniref:Helix-turn-helix domain-containing protein n=1 Tax=Pseudomonas kulmbachensis TaxID=3043408 RepID=A0ABW7LSF6_9PSED
MRPDVPVFTLYGDDLAWPTQDLLHCETIPKRSSLHHWEITPHRHVDLAQVLYIYQGHAQIEIEGQVRVVNDATLQFIPPLCVHGFRFSENVDGYVVTMAAPLVARLGVITGLGSSVFENPGDWSVGNDKNHLYAQLSALSKEYHSSQPGRDVMLQSFIQPVLVWIGRQTIQHRSKSAPSRPGHELMRRFQRLLDTEFKLQPKLESLAHRLGVSARTLNATCRDWTGESALPLLHQRLLLEAKRQLIYTTMSVAQISDALGFAEPTYFARFFRRLTGKSPREFRAGEERL